MPTKSEQMLELFAIVGEYPAVLLPRLPLRKSYRIKLITKLKNSKLIKPYSKDGLRSYTLTAKSQEKMMLLNPSRFEFFLSENSDTGRCVASYSRRLRLHHTAEVTITLYNAGVTIFPDEKPPLFSKSPAAVTKPDQAAFYFSREIKSTGEEHMKIRGSRAIGALFTENEILLVYNNGGSLMKWSIQTELRCKAFMNKRFCLDEDTAIYDGINKTSGLITGPDMELALTLLTSTGGYKKQCFRTDGTFEHFYYAPNTSEGETQIKILCSDYIRTAMNEMLLCGFNEEKYDYHIEHDALTDKGEPVLLAFDFDMKRLRQFHDALELSNQKGLLYCFDFQKAVLEKYLDGLAEIKTISLEKVRHKYEL
jgi:hypothetical protein